jgi:hypothetical protein
MARRPPDRSGCGGTEGKTVNRMRPLLVLVLAFGLLAATAAAAQACEKTWVGGSGGWGEEGAWSPSGVPDNQQSVCITAPGTYTVTLPPNGGQAKTLTVGGSSGVQTVDVLGGSWVYQGETQRVTALAVGSASFAANTRLVLDAAETGSTTVPSEAKGAGAFLEGGTIEELGQVESIVTDPKWDDRVHAGDLKIEPGASWNAASGTLYFIKEGEGGYPWSTSNEGTFTVGAGASVILQPSFSGTAAFTNDGTVVNGGSITGNGANWIQQGGSVSGNPVVLQNSVLEDSAGTGEFLANLGSLTLTGTIPAGQKVTVRGEPNDYQGDVYYETGMVSGGKELVNDGTLSLEAPGEGTSGGSVNVEAGSIQNNGTIQTYAASSSRRVQMIDSITNGSSGNLDVLGGSFLQNNGSAVANNGTIEIAPGALYGLTENASLVNSGVLSPQIASATSFGAVQLTSPCCNGPGRFTAGGTLAPVLVGGFTPAAGQEFELFELDGGQFTGAFGATGGGFSADYAHESAEPAYVGVIYGSPVKPAARSPRIASLSGARGKVTAKLSCPAGGAACSAATLTVSVTEHLRSGRLTAVSAKAKTRTKVVSIGAGSAVLAAGQTRTVTIALSSAGRSLLSRFGKLSALVTLKAAGRTIASETVHITKAPAAKKHG